ncbi:MAG: hypothetical protein IPO08_22180 [Xanthomonadales bacterium]|nr:hypothetical protein [Xanthomonadales bacterium]
MTYQPTYDDLVADLVRWTDDNSDEYAAELPGIINRAQRQVQRDLAVDNLVTRANLTLASGTSEYASPSTMIRSLSVVLSDGTPLERRSEEWVRLYIPQTAAPRYYAELNSVLLIAPKPDTGYSAKHRYLSRIAELNSTDDENWITQNAGDLLLLACLVNSEAFLQSGTSVEMFKAAYDEQVMQAVMELKGQSITDYGQVRQAVKPVEVTR